VCPELEAELATDTDEVVDGGPVEVVDGGPVEVVDGGSVEVVDGGPVEKRPEAVVSAVEVSSVEVLEETPGGGVVVGMQKLLF